MIGFFASLKFYRDGVALQKAANDALAQLSEKTNSIQTQVGGIFDKTLDAALGRRYELATTFEDLERQLSQTKEALLAEVRGEIGHLGDQEQKRIERTVEAHIKVIRDQVNSTKESAEEIASKPEPNAISSSMIGILSVLLIRGVPLTVDEIKQNFELEYPWLPSSNLARRLRELMHHGYVRSSYAGQVGKYEITDAGLRLIV